MLTGLAPTASGRGLPGWPEATGAPLPRSFAVADQTGSVQAEFSWGGVDEIRAPASGDCAAH